MINICGALTLFLKIPVYLHIFLGPRPGPYVAAIFPGTDVHCPKNVFEYKSSENNFVEKLKTSASQ